MSFNQIIFWIFKKKIGFHAKNYIRTYADIFGSELFASRYGPPLGRVDTKIRQNPPKTRPENKNFRLKILFSESTRETPIKKYSSFLDSSCSVGDSARMKYGPGAGPETAPKSKSGPGNQKKPEIRKSGCYSVFGILQGFQNYFYFCNMIFLWRDMVRPLMWRLSCNAS